MKISLGVVLTLVLLSASALIGVTAVTTAVSAASFSAAEQHWPLLRTRLSARHLYHAPRYRTVEKVAVPSEPDTTNIAVEPEPIKTPQPAPEPEPVVVAKPKPVVVAPEPEPEPAPEPAPLVIEESEADEPEVTTSPDTKPAPVTNYLAAVQSEIHRLTNQERSRAGEATLRFDAELAAVAQAHSEDMRDRDYFAHTSPDGCNAACRLAAADYEYWAWGENIAWRSATTLPDAEELAALFVDGWMNSSGHRRNLLSDNFTHEGIGLAQIGNKVYVTVTFADPR